MISKKDIEKIVYKHSKKYDYPSKKFLDSLFDIDGVANAGLLRHEMSENNKVELYNIVFNEKNTVSEDLAKHMALNVCFGNGGIRHNIFAVENGVIFEYTYYIDMTWEMIEKQYNIKRIKDKLRIKDLHNGTQWHAPYKLTGMYRLDKDTMNKLNLLGVKIDGCMLQKIVEQGKVEAITMK